MKIPTSSNLRPLISDVRNGLFIKHSDGSYTNRSSLPVVLHKTSKIAHNAIIQPGQRFKPTSTTGHFEGSQPVNSICFYESSAKLSRDVDLIKHVLEQTGMHAVISPRRTLMEYFEIKIHKSRISNWKKNIVVCDCGGATFMAEIVPDDTDSEFFIGYIILELGYVYTINETGIRRHVIVEFRKFINTIGRAFDFNKFDKVKKRASSNGIDLVQTSRFYVSNSVETIHEEI